MCEAQLQSLISSFPKTELVVYYRHVSDEETEHRGFRCHHKVTQQMNGGVGSGKGLGPSGANEPSGRGVSANASGRG